VICEVLRAVMLCLFDSSTTGKALATDRAQSRIETKKVLENMTPSSDFQEE